MYSTTEALEVFRASCDRFTAALTGVSAAAWVLKPSPSVWLMAQVIEHVTMTDRGVRGLVSRGLRPFEAGEHRTMDDAALATIFDGAGPPPPDAEEPAGAWTDQGAALGEFAAATDALAAWYESADVDLRALTAPHPVLGLFDGVQWLLFAASHHDNHTRDVIELRKMVSPAVG